MPSRLSLIPLALLLVVMPTSAQQIQQSGRGLDANLRLGSGGYNGVGAVAGGRATFGHGGRVLRDPVYRTRAGQIDYHTAFNNERGYRANRQSAYNYDRIGVGISSATPSAGTPGGGGGRAPVRTTPADSSQYAAAYDKGYKVGMADGVAAGETSEQADRQMEMISYGVGFFLGEEVLEAIARDGVDADIDSIIAGFRDGLHGSLPRVSREELERILAELHRDLRGRKAAELLESDPEFRKQHEENLVRSAAFHDAYGQIEGVVTLPNGLQYKVLKPGTGRQPGLSDVVVLTYKVLGVDGHLIAEGTDAEVEINDLTAGGSQIIQMMSEGARWEIAIPPDLAHGPGGRYPDIGPNETVFGTVELLKVK